MSLGGGEETVAQWFRSFTDGQNDAKLLIIFKAYIILYGICYSLIND